VRVDEVELVGATRVERDQRRLEEPHDLVDGGRVRAGLGEGVLEGAALHLFRLRTCRDLQVFVGPPAGGPAATHGERDQEDERGGRDAEEGAQEDHGLER
jgi:hypothetical protein